MSERLTFEKPSRVEIRPGRWGVLITVTEDGGKAQKFIASADSGLTFGDGIFFGTPAEANETLGFEAYQS